jgi:hypothetical protein
VTIYSFDQVLRQRRRLHSIEATRTKRIALWRPVPLIAIAYFAAVELVIMALDNFVSFVSFVDAVLSRISGGSASIVAWLICYAAVPAAIVWLAMNSEIDGRAPHRWAFSCLRFLVKDKHTFCGQPRAARRRARPLPRQGQVLVGRRRPAPAPRLGPRRARLHALACALRPRAAPPPPDHGRRRRGHEVTGYEVADRLEVRP